MQCVVQIFTFIEKKGVVNVLYNLLANDLRKNRQTNHREYIYVDYIILFVCPPLSPSHSSGGVCWPPYPAHHVHRPTTPVSWQQSLHLVDLSQRSCRELQFPECFVALYVPSNLWNMQIETRQWSRSFEFGAFHLLGENCIMHFCKLLFMIDQWLVFISMYLFSPIKM